MVLGDGFATATVLPLIAVQECFPVMMVGMMILVPMLSTLNLIQFQSIVD